MTDHVEYDILPEETEFQPEQNPSLLSLRSVVENEVIKKISCSTQLSMKFFLLKNVKMPTIVGIITFMSGNLSLKKANS